MKVYYEPVVTLLAQPQFTMPFDLPCDFEGVGTDGEWLAEYAGRVCYMSLHNPAHRTTADYLKNILQLGHGSVLEHACYSLLVQGVSRSLSHELVRHRAGFAYSQLSQRYVDASNAAAVMPPALLDAAPAGRDAWVLQMEERLRDYAAWVEVFMEHFSYVEDRTARRKRAREAARSVLPNATETKIVVTGNVRAWRHVLALRGAPGADAEIRRLAVAVYRVLYATAPAFFADFSEQDGGLQCDFPKV